MSKMNGERMKTMSVFSFVSFVALFLFTRHLPCDFRLFVRSFVVDATVQEFKNMPYVQRALENLPPPWLAKSPYSVCVPSIRCVPSMCVCGAGLSSDGRRTAGGWMLDGRRMAVGRPADGRRMVVGGRRVISAAEQKII